MKLLSPACSLLTALLLPACSGGDAASAQPQVHINSRLLGAAQVEDFQEQYGTLPAEGRWWYDTTSGMFGAEGQAAAGFMFPGHDFGPLAADASRGATQVFVNGRQLPASEVQALAALAGGTIPPGRYWLDAQLNWGYEGSPQPAGFRQLGQRRLARLRVHSRRRANWVLRHRLSALL